MSSSPTFRRLSFIGLVALASGIVWLASWQLAQPLLHFIQVKAGITLLYIPAGIRLVILLISGLWGALGIVLAFPFALVQQFPNATWLEIFVYSCIAGIVPYGTVLWTCQTAKVSRDLGSLRAIHLPLLAATVSVTGALAYSLALMAFGRFERGTFLQDFTAMAAGDFLGCFAVVLLVRLGERAETELLGPEGTRRLRGHSSEHFSRILGQAKSPRPGVILVLSAFNPSV